MSTRLFVQAITKFLAGLLIVALLLFIPAGSLGYMNGWLLIILLFVPMFVAGIVMMLKNPGLLESRLNARETEMTQRRVVMMSALMFTGVFVLAGLNYRYAWTTLPDWLVWTASGVFILAYILYAEVLRENTYLSRTIEVREGQKVIDTGLYGVIRHPMYASTLLLFLAMPLILGSLISFAVMLLYVPIIAVRMRNEETVLEKELEGYAEYRKRVRWKVIPFIW